MRRNGHDGTGTVAHQDVVSDEYGNGRAVDRVGGSHTQVHAGLFFVLLTFQIALRSDRRTVRCNCFSRIARTIGPALVHTVISLLTGGFHQRVHELVLRSQHHVLRTEKSIRPSGEYGDRVIGGVGRKNNLCTTGPTNPIPLHGLDLLRPIQIIQIIN